MLLFCEKTIVKESRSFELAHLKKKVWHFCNTFCQWVCFLSWKHPKMNGTLL